jgi:DNA-binding response OmpR family regulator
MAPRSARLLCVGTDLELMETRCAVLSKSGYDAQSATVSNAEILLRREQFDLIVVSAWLSESERDRVTAAAGSTPTCILQGLTLASELLAQVERLLPSATSEVANT